MLTVKRDEINGGTYMVKENQVKVSISETELEMLIQGVDAIWWNDAHMKIAERLIKKLEGHQTKLENNKELKAPSLAAGRFIPHESRVSPAPSCPAT